MTRLGSQVPPARPEAPPPPVLQTGTGLIVGKVVDAGSGRPVSGAIVTIGGSVLSRPGGAGAGATSTGQPGTPISQTTPRLITDGEGRFAFRNLPRGIYTLSASKSGFVEGAYGRLRLSGPSQSITLADGERRGDVTIRMFRYGAITGMVTDEAGEPVVGVQVRAHRRTLVAGRRVLAPSGPSGSTDDRGLYRIGTLTEGEYIISVPAVQSSAPAGFRGGSTPDLQATMNSPGSMGFYFSSGGSQVTRDARFVLQTAGRNTLIAFDAGGRLLVHPTQYYPTATVVSQAEPVTVVSGQERSGIDVQLRLVPTANISGVLLGPDGPAPNYALHLVSTDTGMFSADPDAATTITDTDGSFTFLAVPAGQYVIQTVRVPRQPMAGGGGIRVVPGGSEPGGGGRGIPKEPVLWTATAVALGGDDVDGLTIALREGLKITGRLAFEGSAPVPPPERLASLQVLTETADGRQRTSTRVFGQVDASGQFSTEGLLPGKYLIRAGSPGAGWTLKSAMHAGKDIADLPVELENRDITNVVVTFTDQTTQLQGVVRNAQGTFDSAAVIVFPSDERFWIDQGMSPRRTRMTRSSPTGAYGVSVPPGDYWVIAIGEEFASEWQDPRFLQVLARHASPLTLGLGERRSQDLVRQNVRPPDARLVLGARPQVAGEAAIETRVHGPYADVDAQQVRDARVDQVSGSASVSGVVVQDDGSRQPVRRARVTLRGVGPNERLAITDDAGRFAVGALPPGRYTLTVNKAGYLTSYFGAKRQGRGPGIPIEIGSGQQVTDIVVPLTRGAVITGRVVDEFGEPVAGGPAHVAQYQMVNGQRIQSFSNSATTDDRGVYRFFGLTPGEYFVMASPSPGGSAPWEVRQLSSSEMEGVIAQLARPTSQKTDSTPGAARGLSLPLGGAPAGRGTGSASQPTNPTATSRPAQVLLDTGGRAAGYAPSYYPGTPIAEQAIPLTVSAGQELTGIDVTLRLVPMAMVEGTVISPDGQPVTNPQIMLRPTGDTSGYMFGGGFAAVRTSEGGKFTAMNVAPGRYTIVARGQRPGQPSAAPAPPGPPGTVGNVPSPPRLTLWAMAEIDVAGVNLTGLSLSLREGMTVSGRVAFSGKTLAAPADLKQLRISLGPATGGPLSFSPPPARVEASGTFVIEGALPGKYRISASVPTAPAVAQLSTTVELPPAWTLKSAVLNGRDILDDALELLPDDNVLGVVLTFTDQRTELLGTLLDHTGKPAPGFYIVILPTDRAFWKMPSRRVRSTLSTDGRFRLVGLPPGEYYLAAVTEIDQATWGELHFMEQLAAAGIKLTLAEGEKKVQDIRIAGG